MGANMALKPPMLGGNPQKARIYFEKALQQTRRKFFLAHYYYARYYAVRVQDKELFFKLIQEIIDSDPGELHQVCLMNRMAQQKAIQLKEMSEDLFF
jgi:hypothetical protein